jgi:hypothetical protein
MPRFWLSYDLGLSGDYGPLYTWLDEMGAAECGDGVATFVNPKSREQLSKPLNKIARNGSRLYLIGPDAKGKLVGGFVAGRRRVPAPWAGSAGTEVDAVEDA